MKIKETNWLGWVSLVAFCIVAFSGFKIEITHKHEGPVRHEISSSRYGGDFHINITGR